MTPISDDMVELKPCPFCGKSPNCGSGHHQEDGAVSIWFECPDGCAVSKEKPTYDEALTVWNTRAALEGSVAVPAWQDISTAPKDREIMICGGVVWYSGSTYPEEHALDDVAFVSFDEMSGRWRGEQGEQYDEFYYHKPTHWQEKPKPFAIPRQERGGPLKC